jgi:hypothetical protein
MSSPERQKGGDGVEQQQSVGQRATRVAMTVVIWLVLAAAAAIVTAFVRDIPQLGLKGSFDAVWDTGLTAPADRRWWANIMDWVILLVSLVVAVRVVYPPEDLSDVPKPAGPSGAVQENAAADYPIR